METLLSLFAFPFLPRRVKIAITVGTILVAAFAILYPIAERAKQYHAIYTDYYDHFYSEYLKTLPAHEARYYANYYASYYAEYYVSPSYREALRYSLPEYLPEYLRFPVSAISGMSTSGVGISLIREFEGLRLKPYRDSVGKMTIGYGHLLRRGEYFHEISYSQAEGFLYQDVQLAEAAIKRNVEVELNPNQFDALVSLVYNIGEGNFRNSQLLKKINRQRYKSAADEFLEWQYAGGERLDGLARRRRAERRLFLS